MNEKKRIVKLHQKKYRDEFREFLVEGVKGLQEALKTNAKIKVIMVEAGRETEPEFATCVAEAEKKRVDIFYVVKEEIKELKTTETFPGIMAVVGMEEYTLNDFDLTKPIVLLDRIDDPGNLGTIIRTAEWFGVKNILLSEDSVDPYNEKVVRSTMGSIFRTKIIKSTNIVQDIERLKKEGYAIISLSMDGKDIREYPLQPKTAYIFGSESHGVRPELITLSEGTYHISGNGGAESLNVGIAVGIVLSHIS